MGRITPTDLAVDAFAAFRLTRLITTDHLTEKWRQRIVVDSFVRAGLDVPDEPTAQDIVTQAENLGVPFVPKAARLITCPWCTGWWVACAVVTARRVMPRVWGPVAAALAVSAVTGLLAENA